MTWFSSRRMGLGLSILLLVISQLAIGPRAARAADAFTIDAAHTGVMFHISHMGFSRTMGFFQTVQGDFTFDADDATATGIDLTIKTASVNTNNEKRDEHLRGPDFFNAKQFPEIKFKSTSVTAGEEGHIVTGELTMLGKTRSISFPATIVTPRDDGWGNVRAGITASFVIKRSDFGMSYGLPNVGDDVHVTVSTEATKVK